MVLFELFVNVSAFVGIIIIGLMTYHKNPKSHTNLFYFLFSISIALYLIMNYLAINQPDDIKTLFWIQQVMGIACVINQFFLFLALTFPKTRLEVKPWVFYGTIVFTVIMIILNHFGLVFPAVTPGTTQPIPGPAIPLFILHNALFLGGGTLMLLRRYRKAQGLVRAQFRFFMVGAVVMFICILITNVLLVIFFKITALVGMLPLYMMIFTSFVGYAIVRHRFLDVKMIVARSVSYSFLMFLLGLFYAGSFSVIGTFFNFGNNPRANLLISTVLALIMVYSFQSLRERVNGITDRIFYKNKYDARELLSKLSHIMASTLELDELVDLLMRVIITDMKISKGYLLVTRKNRIEWSHGLSLTGVIKSEFQYKHIQTLLEHAQGKQGDNILIFDELIDENLKGIMRRMDISLFFPLIVKKEVIGAIMLSDKSSGDIYSTEDFHMLNILAPEIAVAVKNSLQYEEIKKFSITLKEEVKEATSSLASANKKLKDLDRMKDDFVSVASHELRTPMTAIKSYLWMALEGRGGRLTEKQKFYLDRAFKSTNRLIKLVNDMLNISRIESGRITVELAKVDVYTLVEDVVDEVRPRANELGVVIEVNHKSGGSDKLGQIKDKLKKSVEGGEQYEKAESEVALKEVPSVTADPDKIKEVLYNLIGNALKFTDKGGIVSVFFTKESNYVRIHVQDTGKGIDTKDIKTLFTKFGIVEGTYTTNKKASGTGLGLYISKSIVELHGGTMAVASKGAGMGATFSFTLPMYKKGEAKTLRPSKGVEDRTLGIVHTGV